MRQMKPRLLSILAALPSSHAFWRLGCGISQRGRIDPIIAPGNVSGHVHMLSGAINISPTSTQESLMAANCTTCSVQADKSAYWTPQLFYQFPNSSLTMVPNSGMVVYYLGRGKDVANAVPFPQGYKVLSGDPTMRSYDSTTMTYLNGRPVADRVSFNCIHYDKPIPETPGMNNTDCPQGLRAQIQFPSCWDGVNAFLPGSKHVTYMSQIDNGECPPTHPKQLPHLFYEVMYSVDKLNGQGGQFIFAYGDTTGYGFHGDFMNGWDAATLNAAVKQCLVQNESGVTEQCTVFQKSFDDKASSNCPMAAPLFAEQVDGILPALPGCNPVRGGPDKAPMIMNCASSGGQPALLAATNGAVPGITNAAAGPLSMAAPKTLPTNIMIGRRAVPIDVAQAVDSVKDIVAKIDAILDPLVGD